jgi:hypothetical protein
MRFVSQDTMKAGPIWDVPIYEEFFRAVRAINADLPKDRQLTATIFGRWNGGGTDEKRVFESHDALSGISRAARDGRTDQCAIWHFPAKTSPWQPPISCPAIPATTP